MDSTSRPAPARTPPTGDWTLGIATHIARLRSVQETLERLERLERDQREQLLADYERAMARAVEEHGPGSGDRAGPYARAFLRQAAVVMHVSNSQAGRMLDAERRAARRRSRRGAVAV